MTTNLANTDIKTKRNFNLTKTQFYVLILITVIFDVFLVIMVVATFHNKKDIKILNEKIDDKEFVVEIPIPVVAQTQEPLELLDPITPPQPTKITLTQNQYQEFIKGLKHWEGFRTDLYVCCGGVPTIGYGFTGKEIKGRTKITRKQADRELTKDILPIYLKMVDEVVTVPINECQRLALASFAFNLGKGNLKLLVDQPNRLNSGNYESVVKKMPLYVKAKGSEKRGLVLRRQWEVKVFSGEITSNYGN